VIVNNAANMRTSFNSGFLVFAMNQHHTVIPWPVAEKTHDRYDRGFIPKKNHPWEGCGLTATAITLRGVEVHNLKQVDLDVPHRQLVVFCGVSGSGKTSLALDTLYAEGQRRYIESFSSYARQFLEQLDKPAAERIDGIPSAVAVTRNGSGRSSRSTLGTSTETADYLRLLFAKIGSVVCHGCGKPVRRDTPQSITDQLVALTEGRRYMITFPRPLRDDEDIGQLAAFLNEDGFRRAIAGNRIVEFGSGETIDTNSLDVIVDRLSVGSATEARILDSLETALEYGDGKCITYAACATAETCDAIVDGRPFERLGFSTHLSCLACEIDYPDPRPQLFSFNSPLGACPICEGFGDVMDIDMELVVPDPAKSLADGAIAPWTTPAYQQQQEDLLEFARKVGIPTDVPYKTLTDEHVALIRGGSEKHEFDGLDGFFEWVEKRKYKMHLRVFLSRWRSYRRCRECGGARLRPEALATRVGGKSIAEISQLKVGEALKFFQELDLTDWQRNVGRVMLDQIEARLGYLVEVGLGYLTLDRMLRTLSGGEMQRATLTSALGSNLVNMLYVLDEPSVGLHPRDIDRLVKTIERLRDRGNSVVVVEHEEQMLRAADHIVEVGPGAGERGGEIVFEGGPEELASCEGSLTGDYLSGRRGLIHPASRRRPDHGWLRLKGAKGHNLKDVTVEFPLGVLCVVTGVSGSGKSTLVEDTLYPAVCRRKRIDAPKPLPYEDCFGDGQIDDVLLVDQSPVGRSPRSNPVTYIKAFDAIRAVFAETVQARTHNYTASFFSFNVEGGRCEACKGDGHIEVDMQFLPNVFMKCPQCKGARYRNEILDVTYRGRNICEVLQMTVREAFVFFRGQTKVQSRLKRLIDVGLDYLRLGQPANTLSAGEAQRLKLAGHMSTAKRGRTLFILDEPTTGLHFSDVVQLLDCLEALLAVGHSLIVVEHNLQLIKAADYIIDMGPGAAEDGGAVVVQGTPEMVTQSADSVTGKYLAEALATN
jgi:excinuclease ABC subunit A